MSQKLIIIRGNSGSGKSTIAKKLRYQMGYETMLIQQDVIRRDILRVKDTDNNPSVTLIYDMAKYGQKIGYDVIVEGILASQRYGEMLRSLVKLFDEVRIYYFDVSFEETLRRHSSKPNAHEFGEKEMREWWIEHDVLGIKDEVIISETMNEAQILQLLDS